MLSFDKGGNVGQRPWSIEGVHGNEVGKNRRFQLPHVFLHPRTFVLEYPDSFSSLKKFVGLYIIYGESICVQLYVVPFLDDFDGVLDQGEGLQSQKVHFQQACGFHHGVVKLGTHHVRILGQSHRNKVGDVGGCNDHPASMDSKVTNRSF